MGLHTVRTLIVDDHAFMRQVLGTMIRAAGLPQPITAETGERAIELLASTDVDILLVDLDMPGFSGLDVTRWVRTSPNSRWHAMPIILVTAHTQRDKVESARDTGITEVVTKPVSPQTLLSRLAAAIDYPRSFVMSDRYHGPDRRRRNTTFAGRDRRQGEAFELD